MPYQTMSATSAAPAAAASMTAQLEPPLLASAPAATSEGTTGTGTPLWLTNTHTNKTHPAWWMIASTFMSRPPGRPPVAYYRDLALFASCGSARTRSKAHRARRTSRNETKRRAMSTRFPSHDGATGRGGRNTREPAHAEGRIQARRRALELLHEERRSARLVRRCHL